MFFCCLMLNVAAQEKLSLAVAVSIAIKNNYSILISKNESEIAVNNNTIGNAGMLPSFNVSADGTQFANDTKQSYSNGLEVDKKNVASNNIQAGADFNWTIFNGFKMFATRNKLAELQAKGGLNLKTEIENTIAGIINSYFDIVRNKELLKSAQSAIEIYEERARISETKFNIGSASKLELLQAKVDLNAQRSALLKNKTALNNAKINLNQLLARPVETDFDVSDSIVITYHPKLDELKKTIIERNNTLLAAQKDLSVSSYSVKQIESLRYPVIGLGAGYNYSRIKNDAGLILLNQNNGLNYGFTLRWNLFNGFNTNSQIKNAKLEYLNSTLHLNDVQSQVESQLLQAFRNFEDALEVLKLEEDNLLLAKEIVTVAFERFRIGNSIPLELKEAQKSFDDAAIRTTSARYDAKVAETELMRLNSELVK